MMIVECYDVGGTKIKGALIKKDQPYSILESLQLKSEKGSMLHLSMQIKTISQHLRSKANIKDNDIQAISIGFPGPVKDEILMSAPPLQIDTKINVKNYLKDFGNKIFIENDLNMAIMAELYYGVGKEKNDFCLLTLSTGIGTGIVINKKVLSGTYGEFGHDVLERSPALSNICQCSNRGCWAAQASGYGIEKTIKKYGLSLTCEEIFSSEHKDKTYTKILTERIRDYNAQGIGNIVNAFPTKMIIVMGSLGIQQFDKIIPSKEEIESFTVNTIPEIKKTSLGPDIGIIGAYTYALSKLGN